jgi:uncharacterized membrane protein YkoI
MISPKQFVVSFAALGLIGTGQIAWAKISGSIPTQNHHQNEFPKLAKISSSEAAKAATEKIPGDVLSIALENEDGSLVYAVEVVNSQSGLHEINIDAGNGKILSNETKDHSHR